MKTRGLDNTVLTADDYVFIQDLLRSHPDHAVKDEDYQPHR